MTDQIPPSQPEQPAAPPPSTPPPAPPSFIPQPGGVQPGVNPYSGYVNCPRCGSPYASKVGYTWWGGFLGPSILHHVRCSNCQNEYNGKTGKSNTNGIIIYSVVLFVGSLAICGLFWLIITALGGL